MSTLATFRSQHDRHGDEAILLSGLSPEPALSGNYCIIDGVVVGLVEVKRSRRLHHAQERTWRPRKTWGPCAIQKEAFGPHLRENLTFKVQGPIGVETSSTLSLPMPRAVDVRMPAGSRWQV